MTRPENEPTDSNLEDDVETPSYRKRLQLEGERLMLLTPSEAAGEISAKLSDILFTQHIYLSLSTLECASLQESIGLLEAIRHQKIRMGIPLIRESIIRVFNSHDFSVNEKGDPQSARLGQDLADILRYVSQCGLTTPIEFASHVRSAERIR